jgi:hypothetical protein
VRVVEDSDSLLATFIPEAAPLSYAEDPDVVWPTESGRHPWWPAARWRGHGVLMLQRPGEPYAVWHFWAGPERRFEFWYLNLQEPFRRSAIGYDTQDHELDVVVSEDLQWFFKDEDKLAERAREGRYSESEMASIHATGARIAAMLDARDLWWDLSLKNWQPDPSWDTPDPPEAGWESVPWTTAS